MHKSSFVSVVTSGALLAYSLRMRYCTLGGVYYIQQLEKFISVHSGVVKIRREFF